MQRMRKGINLTVIFSMIFSVLFYSVLSAEEKNTNSSLGKIKFLSNSYVELKEAYTFNNANQTMAVLYVDFYNGENNELDLIDYWFKLKSVQGNSYTIKQLNDTKTSSIAPKTKATYIYYAEIGTNMSISDLIVQFIKWELSSADFEKKLGEIKIPKTYNNAVAISQAKSILIGNKPFSVQVKDYQIFENEKEYFINLVVNIENIGKTAAKIPNVRFKVSNNTGLEYPLVASLDIGSIDLYPRVSNEVELSVSIPKEAGKEGLKLIVSEHIQEKNLEYPLAAFQLPKTSTSGSGSSGGSSVSLGNKYDIKTTKGNYKISLNSIHRMPWQDEDIISANITLYNESKPSLPIPNLVGYFKFDGIQVGESQKLVQLDKVISIQKGTSTNLQISVKIPYSYRFSDIELYLEESTNNKTNKIITFKHNSTLTKLPVLSVGSKMTLDGEGRKSEITVARTSTYDSNSSKVMYAELEMKNLEKRHTNLTKLVGYFKTKDNYYYPATITELKEKVPAKGSVILSAWSVLPKEYELSDVQIVLGEAVKGEKVIVGEGEADSIANAKTINIPIQENVVKNTFEDLEIYPYTLSITKVRAETPLYPRENKINIEMDYSLKNTIENDFNKKSLVVGHKVLFELVDGATGEKFESAVEIDNETGLNLGDNTNFIVSINDKRIGAKLNTFAGYTLNVYDYFQGHKKLLASRKFDWFITWTQQ